MGSTTQEGRFVPFVVDSEQDYDDAGIYLEGQDQVESDVPYTPEDTDTSDPSLEDSGYNDSLCLQCNEDTSDWTLTTYKSYISPGGRECTLSRSLQLQVAQRTDDHQGFHDHLETIYQHRLSIEYKFQVRSFLDNQPEVTPAMRGLLISWMIGLHHHLNLSQDTLFIAVNIVDRVLDIMQASRDYLQLLGITAILIASKVEDIHPPEINDLLGGCTEIYTRDQVKQLERVVLVAIRFDILVPTSQFFLEYFASKCLMKTHGFKADYLRQARAFARYLLELSLQDYDLSQMRPSILGLCVWKVAVEETQANDENFIPTDLFFSQDDFECIYNEVKSFTQNLKVSYPDILSLCESYKHLYGKE
ncbi:hypothetical protein FSP39_014390 [Pinctada imbricata]|uniref:Cyclin-like domain-containing protein n=1 Tax=Pinctada imbricata TaxID=66713 RepID=A0AA88Y4I4_PINIB|nr:hypothetical protein FSP39_014390 [Pinctada imbricata]